MAISKKKKKTWVLIIAAIAAVLFAPKILSDLRLRGSWDGQTLADIKKKYPGLRVSLFGNEVTIGGGSNPDLKGTLLGDVIAWKDGSNWRRG